jgi:putative NADH-flavin reductase
VSSNEDFCHIGRSSFVFVTTRDFRDVPHSEAAIVQAQPKTSLRLFILGATGGIGRAILDQGLRRGHSMTAFVRSPQKLEPRDGLTILKGDPRHVDELRASIPGHDAVLSALGPPGPGPTTLHRDCARTTLNAMEASNVRRLLAVSAAVLFRDQGFVFWLFRSTLLRNIADDTEGMERLLQASGVDWTVVRPPRLTNGPLTERYLVADGSMPRGGLSLARADVAHFLLNEVEEGRHLRAIVGMAGGKRATAPARPALDARAH